MRTTQRFGGFAIHVWIVMHILQPRARAVRCVYQCVCELRNSGWYSNSFIGAGVRAFIVTTTFIRDMGTLLQIRQFAQLRSASCSMQGLSPPPHAVGSPSRDLTLGVVHVGFGNRKVTKGQRVSRIWEKEERQG